MNGILYGVGVGPGDPSLLTFKAVETIRRAAVVAVPETGGERMALRVAEAYLGGKEILPCPMPMTRDAQKLRQSHEAGAAAICGFLAQGRDVAFLTLGDPTVYSTYMALHRLVTARGFAARIVPGVPSFCAAAASLGVPLCEGGEALHIIPASYEGLEENLALKGTKVLMKAGHRFAQVKSALRGRGLLQKSRMAERCGMEDERLVQNLAEEEKSGGEDSGGGAGYFSVIVVKDEG